MSNWSSNKFINQLINRVLEENVVLLKDLNWAVVNTLPGFWAACEAAQQVTSMHIYQLPGDLDHIYARPA